MARFDIYQDQALQAAYLLDIQSDFHDYLVTRITIPIVSKAFLGHIVSRIHLPISVEGKQLYVASNYMAAVPATQLGKCVGSAENISYDITAAIDFLMQGF